MSLPKNEVFEYTAEHLEAMEAVRDGADVISYSLARRLREVEKTNPEYTWIRKLAGDYPNVMAKLPYFGCILTDQGKLFLDSHKEEEHDS